MVSQKKIFKNGKAGCCVIDFTNSIQKNKAYAGANGGKIAVMYNGEQYMLKFPKIVSRIDMAKVFEIIDNTQTLTEIQRDFYKTMLSERKRRILDFAVSKI